MGRVSPILRSRIRIVTPWPEQPETARHTHPSTKGHARPGCRRIFCPEHRRAAAVVGGLATHLPSASRSSISRRSGATVQSGGPTRSSNLPAEATHCRPERVELLSLPGARPRLPLHTHRSLPARSPMTACMYGAQSFVWPQWLDAVLGPGMDPPAPASARRCSCDR
jgi:hypothetical protein